MPTATQPWRKKILIPVGINTKYHGARVSTMRTLFGSPTTKLTADCQNDHVSATIKHRIETRNVGPFRVTGLDLFLDILEKMFAEYKVKHPQAYADLCTAGVLCVRLVRGSNKSPSNHCWGTAIDLGFGGVIDSRGDGYCFQGLLDLYAIAKKYKLFWGASFNTEDAMHFEASEELIREWRRLKLI